MTPEEILIEIQKLPVSAAKFILMKLNAYIQLRKQSVSFSIVDFANFRNEATHPLSLNKRMLLLPESVEYPNWDVLILLSLNEADICLWSPENHYVILCKFSKPTSTHSLWRPHSYEKRYDLEKIYENIITFIRSEFLHLDYKMSDKADYFVPKLTPSSLQRVNYSHRLNSSNLDESNEPKKITTEEIERLEDEFEQMLFSNGIISQIPPRKMSNEEFDEFELIEFEDEPLSEQIIRERR